MRNPTEDAFQTLAARQRHLPEEVRPLAESVKALRPEILRRFRTILDRRITALRTRTHGDFHLGQVLWTGRDYVMFDFEGDPARPISTRRIKRSPLRDVAGMIRSYHYAAHHALAGLRTKGLVPAGPEGEALRSWVDFWHAWVSSAFLGSYLHTAAAAPFLPGRREELNGLLTVYLLERAVYELGHELNTRPEWARLPLEGIAHLVEISRGA
jgi:maltose alpha-D-glucosyltransferase/alpha-amylase